jgi:hypothetical protein
MSLIVATYKQRLQRQFKFRIVDHHFTGLLDAKFRADLPRNLGARIRYDVR